MRKTAEPAFRGIGVDIIEVERVRRLCGRQPAFLRRFFTPAELAYCRKGKNFHERLAARFCAKEAVIKALDRKDLPLKSVSVVRSATGRPEVRLSGPGLKGVTVRLSLSHTSNYACASAIAFDGGAKASRP